MSEHPRAVTVVRTSEQPWSDALARGHFHSQRKELGGLDLLRCGLWQLMPGKRSFPLHSHGATEEALFVVSGRCKVRTPDGEIAVGPGDYVAFPARGPAHQLENDGAEPVVYVAMSANAAGVDVVEYPDSGKVACSVGAPPAGRRFVFRKDQQVDYFDGEKGA
jgi:uncharacterized cupin superfamily protein